ncbi:MAG: hypothetical protein WCC57_05495 [Paracoccaceae bacterium]
MKQKIQLLVFAMMFAVAGCADPGRYPVSGEECGPNDPVLDMSAPDCGTVPAT